MALLFTSISEGNPCSIVEPAVLTWNMFGGCPTNLSHLEGVSMSNEVFVGRTISRSNCLSLLDNFSGFKEFVTSQLRSDLLLQCHPEECIALLMVKYRHRQLRTDICE